MPLVPEIDPNTRERRLTIACDHPGCGAGVTDPQIKDGGGLLEMGWLRRFNEQARRNECFCPDHKEEHCGN